MLPSPRRYWPSERSYPEQLPPVEYPAAELVRKVQDKGRVEFRGHRLHVPQGYRGLPVALRPDTEQRVVEHVTNLIQQLA